MSGVVCAQPDQVATPLTVAAVRPPVHENVPAALLIASVILVTGKVVATLPPASVIATTGCGVKVAGVDAAGYASKVSLLAGPTLTVNVPLSIAMLPFDARSRYEPARSILQAWPVKSATPLPLVLSGLVV